MRIMVAFVAAILAVSVAVDLPPLEPELPPPVRRTPARCDVPRSLDEAHDTLGRLMSPDLVRALASKSEEAIRRDDLRLGHWIRQFWDLWNGGPLYEHLRGLGLRHPDEMSELVLVTWWRHLNGRPLRVGEEVARFAALRSEGAFYPDPRCVCHSRGACQRQEYVRSHEGKARAFMLLDCCCGLRSRVSEGVVYAMGLSEPKVFPFFVAMRREGVGLCREVPFAAP